MRATANKLTQSRKTSWQPSQFRQKKYQASASVKLRYADFQALCVALQISAERLAQVADISLGMLRERRPDAVFSSAESSRLERYSSLFHDSVYALGGDPVIAADWLKSPVERFNGLTPLEFVATEAGYQEVCGILGRLADDAFV